MKGVLRVLQIPNQKHRGVCSFPRVTKFCGWRDTPPKLTAPELKIELYLLFYCHLTNFVENMEKSSKTSGSDGQSNRAPDYVDGLINFHSLRTHIKLKMAEFY